MKAPYQFITLYLTSITCTPSTVVSGFSSTNQNNIAPPTTDRRSFIQTVASVTAASSMLLTQGVSSISAAQEDNIGATGPTVGGKLRLGDEDIMRPKAHGTSEIPVQDSLRYGVSNKLADKICNFNRR
jgi:hypothetical protein